MTGPLYLTFLSFVPLAYLHFIADDKHLIVGGETVSIKDYPYFASIRIETRTYGASMCSGVIIGKKWILSVAHCFWVPETEPQPKVTVAIGFDRYGRFNSFQVPVANFYLHPNFGGSSPAHDIALVELAQELQYKETVAKIRLPKFKEEYSAMQQGAKVTVVGFGRTKQKGYYSERLRGIEVRILDDNRCDGLGGSFNKNFYLCAGTLDGSKDSCEGDSGGPLAYKTPGGRVLLGLVAFGSGCARRGFPGAYLRVSAHTDWILKTIENAVLKNG